MSDASAATFGRLRQSRPTQSRRNRASTAGSRLFQLTGLKLWGWQDPSVDLGDCVRTERGALHAAESEAQLIQLPWPIGGKGADQKKVVKVPSIVAPSTQ